MAAKTKPVVISDRTWQGRQSWNRELIESVGAERLRYTVKVDAHDFQSYAKVEVWKDKEWSTVHRIPGQQLKVRVSYVTPIVSPVVFDHDIAELRKVATAVVL